MKFTREELLARFRNEIASGRPIVGAGAGCGLTAKCAELGGIDLLIIYNSGRFRMAGRGSTAGLLAYSDANAVVIDMAKEVLTIVKNTPVMAGVNGTDPFRDMDVFLEQIKSLGFSGVQNFPTVGLFDGTIRQNLEETGMGYGLEVEMIALAHQKGFLTTPYVFNTKEAEQMAAANADIIVAHMGLTSKGTIGAQTTMTLEQAAQRVQEIADAARRIKPDALVICHGGPIADPDDVTYIFENTDVVGFFGASSIERLAAEPAMEAMTRAFKSLPIK